MFHMQHDVKLHTLALMRWDSSTAPFEPGAVATPQQVRGWRRVEGECCDVENFCLDLSSTPGTEWNKSATKVFVNNFLAVGTYECTDHKKIATMFKQHFRTIKRHYLRQREETDATARGLIIDRTPEKMAKARQQRKYNVRCPTIICECGEIDPPCLRLTSVGSVWH